MPRHPPMSKKERRLAIARRDKLVDRRERTIVHELWIPLVVRPLNGCISALGWYLRTRKTAFTPKEKVYLEKRMEILQKISSDLMTVYYRLKR